MVAVRVRGREYGRQPLVDAVVEGVLARVDVAGVADLVGQGVLGGEPAPVIGRGVDPLALDAAVAFAAEQRAGEGVAALSFVRLVLALAVAAAGQDGLRLGERIGVDDGRMGDLLRPDPLPGVVPPHLRLVAEGDVSDVHEHLVLALPVPHLPAGVAGVGQDRPDGTLRPGQPAPVRVTSPVMRGRARDAVCGQPLGDGEDPGPGQEFGEDQRDHRSGGLVER